MGSVGWLTAGRAGFSKDRIGYSVIFSHAKRANQRCGSSPGTGGGITHLQYADDTVVMVACDDESITNMKFLLYCFEWMSGLKINYHKSEVYVFGVEETRQIEISNMLNCKIEKLPMTRSYLPKHLRGLLTK